jgi:hypothetical protein
MDERVETMKGAGLVTDEDKQVRPFADWLREQSNGAAHEELTESLNELVGAVLTHEKSGDLTLTIKVKPAGHGSNTLFVTADVKLKAPRAESPSSLFFADRHHNLLRDNPNQMTFGGLREVPKPESTEVKEATSGSE